jgi:hypothetical protein
VNIEEFRRTSKIQIADEIFDNNTYLLTTKSISPTDDDNDFSDRCLCDIKVGYNLVHHDTTDVVQLFYDLVTIV